MSEKIGKLIFRVNFTVENYFYSIHNANQHFSIWSIPIESILVFLHIVQKIILFLYNYVVGNNIYIYLYFIYLPITFIIQKLGSVR